MSWFDSIQGAVDAASSLDILNLDQMAVEQENEEQLDGADQNALEEAMYAEIERVNATLERERSGKQTEEVKLGQPELGQTPAHLLGAASGTAAAAAVKAASVKLKKGKDQLGFFGLGLNATEENSDNRNKKDASPSRAPISFSVNEAVNVGGLMREATDSGSDADVDLERGRKVEDGEGAYLGSAAASEPGVGNYQMEWDDSTTLGANASASVGAGTGIFGEFTFPDMPIEEEQPQQKQLQQLQPQHSQAKLMLQARLRGASMVTGAPTGLLGSLLSGGLVQSHATGGSGAATAKSGFFDEDDDELNSSIAGGGLASPDGTTGGGGGFLSDPILAQVQRNKEREKGGGKDGWGYMGGSADASTNHPSATPSKSQIGLQNLMASIVPVPLSPMYSGLEEPGEGAQVHANVVAPEMEQGVQEQGRKQKHHQHESDSGGAESGNTVRLLLRIARGCLDCFVAISATAIAVIQAVVLPLANALQVNINLPQQHSRTQGAGAGGAAGTGMNTKDFYYQRAWKVATSKRGMIILGVMLLLLAWTNVVSEGSFLDLEP